MDILMTIIVSPVFFFPFLAGYSNGVLSYFEVNPLFQLMIILYNLSRKEKL